MADKIAVFIPCDKCRARSEEIWTKVFDGNVWPLSFCGHHSRDNEPILTAQEFVKMDALDAGTATAPQSWAVRHITWCRDCTLREASIDGLCARCAPNGD